MTSLLMPAVKSITLLSFQFVLLAFLDLDGDGVSDSAWSSFVAFEVHESEGEAENDSPRAGIWLVHTGAWWTTT